MAPAGLPFPLTTPLPASIGVRGHLSVPDMWRWESSVTIFHILSKSSATV